VSDVTEPARVQAWDVAAGYEADRPVVSGVSFACAAGEAVAILGPNGGGKTTLLRALLGELAVSTGRFEVNGDVAYVAQGSNPRLDFPVSALDVALMGAFGRTPWYRRVPRASGLAALERVGLAPRARVRYGELSGGERQRVLLARALVQEADVLLLDEPLAAIDPASEARILALLDELRTEGRALLVSTHDIEGAGRFDRVLCLRGRQVAFGAPEQTLTPSTLEATYGPEIVILRGGERAVAVGHHEHADEP
jgi:ABC-type Mn2+/Zn2+ transport system ATPase subunit